MKKKPVTDEEDGSDLLGKQKKKPQSDFMKQLTDLAQQAVEPSPPPPPLVEPPADEIQRQVNPLYLFHSQNFLPQRKRKDRQVPLEQLAD